MEQMNQEQLEINQQADNMMPVPKKTNLFVKIWRIIYPMLIYLIISIIVSIALVIVISIMVGITSTGVQDAQEIQKKVTQVYTKNAMLSVVLSGIFMYPIAFLLFRSDRKKETLRIGIIPKHKITVLEWVFILGLSITTCVGVNNWLGISRLSELFPGFSQTAEMIYGGNIILQIVAVVFIGPVIEELIFRGLAYKRICEYVKPKTAVVISAILFALYHMNVVQGVYAFIIGLILGFLYLKTNTIWAPIAFHVCANLSSVIMTGLSDNQESKIVTTPFLVVISLFVTLIAITLLIRLNKMKMDSMGDDLISNQGQEV